MSSIYLRIILESFILILLIIFFIYRKKLKKQGKALSRINSNKNNTNLSDTKITSHVKNINNNNQDNKFNKTGAHHNTIFDIEKNLKDKTIVREKENAENLSASRRVQRLVIYPQNEHNATNTGVKGAQQDIAPQTGTVDYSLSNLVSQKNDRYYINNNLKDNNKNNSHDSIKNTNSYVNNSNIYNSNITSNQIKDNYIKENEAIKLITFFDVSYLFKNTGNFLSLMDEKASSMYIGYSIENQRLYLEIYKKNNENCFIFYGDGNKCEYIIYNYIVLLKKKIASLTSGKLSIFLLTEKLLDNPRFNQLISDTKKLNMTNTSFNLQGYFLMLAEYNHYLSIKDMLKIKFAKLKIPYERVAFFLITKEEINSTYPTILAA